MGITERHWFENEEPELTNRQLEDAISIQDRVYRRGYYKGYSDRNKEIVRCKDCKYRPKEPDWKTYESGFDIEFPECSICPCQCSGDGYYSWYPEDDWFCADGERKEGR